MAGRVRGDKCPVARRLDVLGHLVEDEVPGHLLPGGGARGLVQGPLHPPGGDGQIHRRRAFGAQPALVYGTVRVPFDLQQLRGSVGLSPRVRQEGASDGAVRADGVGLGRPGDAQRLADRVGLGEVEPKLRESERSGAHPRPLDEISTRERGHSVTLPESRLVGNRELLSILLRYDPKSPLATENGCLAIACGPENGGTQLSGPEYGEDFNESTPFRLLPTWRFEDGSPLTSQRKGAMRACDECGESSGSNNRGSSGGRSSPRSAGYERRRPRSSSGQRRQARRLPSFAVALNRAGSYPADDAAGRAILTRSAPSPCGTPEPRRAASASAPRAACGLPRLPPAPG